jgi:hypothetical protein
MVAAGSSTREEEVGGELSADGTQLVLHGSVVSWSDEQLRGGVGFPLSQPLREPLIHGYAGGKQLALLNAACDWPRFPGAMGAEVWRVEAAVEAHIQPDPSGTQRFGGLGAELRHLPAWCRAPEPSRSIHFDERRIDVSAAPRTLADCVLDTGVQIRIEQSVGTHSDGTRLEVDQPVALQIETAEHLAWAGFLEHWLQPIQVLMWLGVAEASTIDALYLRVEHPDRADASQWSRLWVPLVEPKDEGRTLHHADVLFFSDELPGGFDRGIVRWLEIWTDLRHLLAPLFARDLAPFVYANDRFYTAASAMEAYHRYKSDSLKDLPKAQHRARVEKLAAVLQAHAPELVDWAVNAAQPFNRAPLWKRMLDVFTETGDVGHQLLGEHAQLFAEIVEAERNGHAHALADDSRLAGSEFGSGLYLAAQAITWMLRARIMADLGFSAEDAAARIVRNPKFTWLAPEVRKMLDAIAGAVDSP